MEVNQEPLTILTWEHPMLSMICEKIEDNEFGPKLELFGQQLHCAMDSRDGLGLAAPQVGVLKRVFVMRFPDHRGLDQVVCNPTLDLSGITLYEKEGCLSLPDIFEQVSRAEKVTMQYQDSLGLHYELLLDKFDARVAQHEFDHLQGIMFFNHTDKRPVYGARMSKQVSKHVLRMWKKSGDNYVP